MSSKAGVEDLSNEELRGYEWVKSKVSVSRREYQEHFGLEERTASRHLKRFAELVLVVDNGESSKSNKYRYVISS